MQAKATSNGYAPPEALGFFKEFVRLYPAALKLCISCFPSEQANTIKVLPHQIKKMQYRKSLVYCLYFL